MKKLDYLFSIIFPILDHLYIFQVLEYEPTAFLNWFLKHPGKRNLQRKHQLILTSKTVLLLLTATFFLTIISLIISVSIFTTLLAFPFLFLLNMLMSPFYLIISQLLLKPFEEYQKKQLYFAAQRKISKLSDIKVVAITGSFAKTSTKDILYTLLWKKFRVVKSPKSYNTEISLARTILNDLKASTQVFIAEIDAYRPGENDRLAKLVKPRVGVITSIAPQHLERFGSMENLAKTQFELANNLPKEGVLFLNSSDPKIMELASQDDFSEKFPARIKYYGLRKEDTLSASNIKQSSKGISFVLRKSNTQIDITLPLFGEHHVINFLAASAVALELGLSLKEIQQRASKILPTPHRLEIKKQGTITIIDNSYNTNPIVAKTSLNLLRDYPGKQKIIITPGLVELGSTHSEENQLFAQEAANVANQIIIVGRNAQKDLLAGLSKAHYPQEQIHQVDNLTQGMRILANFSNQEIVVLLENDLPDQYF